jgi:hypothetical protein
MKTQGVEGAKKGTGVGVSNMHKYKRGDTVYAVYNLGCSGERMRPVKVKSVGPKWVTTDWGQFQSNGGAGDFGWYLYPSLVAVEEQRRRQAMVSEILNIVGYARLMEMPTEKLQMIVDLLRRS